MLNDAGRMGAHSVRNSYLCKRCFAPCAHFLHLCRHALRAYPRTSQHSCSVVGAFALHSFCASGASHHAPALRDFVAPSWARSHNQRFSETSFQNLFYAHFTCTQKGGTLSCTSELFHVSYFFLPMIRIKRRKMLIKSR